jgi:anti-sigma factor RsiW
MNISRDVITDLLPLYLAGEASPATQALLEDYLRANPGFAVTVREAADRSAALLAALPEHRPSDAHEKATLERVRRFNRRRANLLGLSIGFALMLFAFSFEGRHIQWLMLRDSPRQAVFFLIAAFSCSIAYIAMGLRLRR